MISAFEARQGTCIEYNGEIWRVINFNFIKMQQRKPVVRLQVKSLQSGRVLEITFQSDEKVKDVPVYVKPAQFMYKTGDAFVFMNMETYEEIYVDADKIKKPEFIGENTQVNILINGETGEIIGCELPPAVELKVIKAEKGVKGDTATNATKPVVLETQYIVQVPLFIEEGDIIKIDTETGKYIERVKHASK